MGRLELDLFKVLPPLECKYKGIPSWEKRRNQCGFSISGFVNKAGNPTLAHIKFDVT